MTTGRRKRVRGGVVTLRIVGRNTLEASGPGVITAIRDVGCAHMPSRTSGGWQAPAAFADELEARLTAAGFRVEWSL